MSDTTWHFLNNQFETATANSFKLANILNNDHLSKLVAENADPDIAALEARTQPPASDYGTKYAVWISASATYKGHTQMYNTLLDQLSGQKIKEWDIQIQGQYLEGTPEYTILLPNRRGPFQKGGKDERLSQVQALATRLNDFPALAATQVDVAAYYASMFSARNAQQQKEELVSMASDQLQAARMALTTMMYGNLGVLMDKYRETPAIVENFWQLDLIRNTGGGSEPDLPDTSVQVSGTVRDATTTNPIMGASVVVFDGVNPDGGDSIEVFTDMNGNYTIDIEDLPAPYSVALRATHTGYLLQDINIDIAPGNNYPGNDFNLSVEP